MPSSARGWSAAPASLPKAQATIASIEFGFTGPTTLHDGELVVVFARVGELVVNNRVGDPRVYLTDAEHPYSGTYVLFSESAASQLPWA